MPYLNRENFDVFIGVAVKVPRSFAENSLLALVAEGFDRDSSKETGSKVLLSSTVGKSTVICVDKWAEWSGPMR